MGACVSMPASAAADLFDLPFRAATAASKLPPYRWWRAAGRPPGPGILPGRTRGAGSFGTNMAERAGFEPAVHPLEAYNRLAGDRFRPLSHLSAAGIPVISDKEACLGQALPPGLSRRLPIPGPMPIRSVRTRILAEGAGFEPARLSSNGFQDRRHRPLGHPSVVRTGRRSQSRQGLLC